MEEGQKLFSVHTIHFNEYAVRYDTVQENITVQHSTST